VKSKNGIILFAVNGLARSVQEQNAIRALVGWYRSGQDAVAFMDKSWSWRSHVNGIFRELGLRFPKRT
jgi:hypothetical protein